MTSRPVSRTMLLTLCGMQFTYLLDYVIMMPLGPQLTARFGISDAQFGALVSAYSFAAAASGLLAATYVDRFDRKRLLLTTYALFALATLSCAWADRYPVLLVARIAAGLFGGVLSAQVQTFVADCVPPQARGRAMALVMSAFPLSTVLGVPLALALAARWSWQMPFAAIAAASALLLLCAALSLPSVTGHLHVQAAGESTWARIARLLADANHVRAFAFTALLMLAGSSVIPFVTLYMQANVGLTLAQIPWLYFCGGLATLIAARVVGSLSDRLGMVRVYRITAVLALPPLFALTWLPPVPLALALCVSTAFFMCMSARMVPGMAIVQSVPAPAVRGTFMTLNASVQTAAMGVGAFIGGHIISRDAQGLLQNYGWVGLLSALASVWGFWLAGRLRLQASHG